MKKVMQGMSSCISIHESIDSMERSARTKEEAHSNKITTAGPQLNSSPRTNCVLSISTKEVFFDSQPWIESDSEEFLSVNAYKTPYFGTSPNNEINNGCGVVLVDKKR